MLAKSNGKNRSTIPYGSESRPDSRMIRTRRNESARHGTTWTHSNAMDNICNRVGIVKKRATYVHDNLYSTHGALHHGCYLCVWEGVKAYSSRHVTDFRHVVTNPQKIPPPARTIPCNELIRQGGPHRDGQRHRTYEKADEGRCGEAILGARHQYHPGDQHVSQAGSEGAEDPLRGRRQTGRGPSSREPGRAEPAYRIDRRVLGTLSPLSG